jgi:Zn-dependent protease with chaperone function
VIAARYFDGKTAKAHAVTIGIQAGQIVVVDEANQVVLKQALDRVQIQERLNNTSQKIDLGGGALLEVADQTALATMLAQAGIHPSTIAKAQRSWRWVLGSLVAMLLVVVLGYLYGLPMAASAVAHALPASLEKRLGDEVWPSMDGQEFQPSTLDTAQQNRLRERFSAMAVQVAPDTKVILEFRASIVGPNAFALPGGRIVLTDALVKLSRDEDAVLGVLAHELGHVVHRHVMRNLLQTAAVGIVVSVWLGDTSSLVALVPTLLASARYSRDFEREADLFALQAMRAIGASTNPMADLLEKLQGEMGDGDRSILSTHPLTSERAKVLRGQSKD